MGKLMKEFKFNCPHCQERLQATEELIGRQFQCPGCNHPIRVPPSPDSEKSKTRTIESGRTWDTFLPPGKPKE